MGCGGSTPRNQQPSQQPVPPPAEQNEPTKEQPAAEQKQRPAPAKTEYPPGDPRNDFPAAWLAKKVLLNVINQTAIVVDVYTEDGSNQIPLGRVLPGDNLVLNAKVLQKFYFLDVNGKKRDMIEIDPSFPPAPTEADWELTFATPDADEINGRAASSSDGPKERPRLAAEDGSIFVRFVNGGAVSLDYFWRNKETNKLKKYGTIQPFSEVDQETYVDHSWYFYDRQDKLHKTLLIDAFTDEYVTEAELSQMESDEAWRNTLPKGIPAYRCKADEVTLEETLSKYPRGGPFGGFLEDPTPAIAKVLKSLPAGKRFVDTEFPPVYESLQRPAASSYEEKRVTRDIYFKRLADYAEAQPAIRSKHVDHDIDITFKNDLPCKVTVGWVNYKGELPSNQMNTVGSGLSVTRKSWAGHIFKATPQDGSGRELMFRGEPDSPAAVTVRVSKLPPFPSTKAAGASVLGDGSSPHDIVQGYVGNCWFCGALSSCAVYPKAIAKCFPSSQHPDAELFTQRGIHVLRLLATNGKHYFYVLDDYIAIIPEGHATLGGDAGLAYFSKPQKGKMWVALFEKLYAKFRGSFINLSGSSGRYGAGRDPQSVHTAIMGGKGTLFEWEVSGMAAFEKGGGWLHLMRLAKDPRSTVSVTSRNEKNREVGEVREGLVAFHAYALVDAREFPDDDGNVIRLLQIRNTWGRTEWTGAWSDGDDIWYDHVDIAEACGYDYDEATTADANDGCFWMELSDFVNKFQRITYNDHERQLLKNNAHKQKLLDKVAAGKVSAADETGKPMSKSESRWRELFDRFDADANGYLSREEVEELLDAYCDDEEDKSIAMREFDSRKVFSDGKVTFDEFCVVASANNW